MSAAGFERPAFRSGVRCPAPLELRSEGLAFESFAPQTDRNRVQPLLVNTDETSQAYLREIDHRLSGRGSTSNVVFVDALLRRDHPHDNYMVYLKWD